jgi:hypothetical protein
VRAGEDIADGVVQEPPPGRSCPIFLGHLREIQVSLRFFSDWELHMTLINSGHSFS